MSVTSLFLVFALIFGNISVLPGDMSSISSGQVNVKIQGTLNNPAEDNMAKYSLVSLLDGLDLELDLKFNTSENLKELGLHAHVALSNSQVGESIEFDFWSKTDFSDRNVPKSYIVMKAPQEEQYSVLDIQKPQTNPGNMGFVFQPFLNPENIKELYKRIGEATDGYKTNVTENENGYTIVLDEDAVLALFHSSVLETVKSLPYMFGGSSNQAIQELELMFANLASVGLFSEDALVANITTNSDKTSLLLDSKLNIKTNPNELLAAFGGMVNGLAGDEKELDMTVSFTADFNNINEDIDIAFPKLDEENSFYIYTDELDIDVNKVNIVTNTFELAQLINEPFIDKGTTYLPLRETLKLLGFTDDDIIWSDGLIILDFMGSELYLNINSPTISQGDYSIDMESQVLLVGVNTYVPAELFGILRLGEISNLFYGENDEVIGSVVSLHGITFPTQREDFIRILVPSDLDPSWLENIAKAADYIGITYELISSDASEHTERTNLVIAAGEPMIIFSNMDKENLEKLWQQGAFYEVVQVDDNYSILIPSTMRNADVAMEFVKLFFDFLDK